MLSQKQADALLEAATALITNINNLITGVQKAAADIAPAKAGAAAAAEVLEPAASTSQQPTKKAVAEGKKLAKLKAGELLKELGKERLAAVLAEFGSAKFSELQDDLHIYEAFIGKADKLLAAGKTDPLADPLGEDDDLLGDGPAATTEPAKEYTAEDVKELFLKVNNAPELGRETTKQLLAELGVMRLTELTKDKYAQAITVVTAALTSAGVK